MEISCCMPPGPRTVEYARLAEELGYRRLWLYDSPLLYPDVWMTLARVLPLVGRSRAQIRGFPASGWIWRTSISGRNIRSNCLKRGAKSVISTPHPWLSKSRVTRIAELCRYLC